MKPIITLSWGGQKLITIKSALSLHGFKIGSFYWSVFDGFEKCHCIQAFVKCNERCPRTLKPCWYRDWYIQSFRSKTQHLGISFRRRYMNGCHQLMTAYKIITLKFRPHMVRTSGYHIHVGCIYHHTSGVELRFPNDFQGDFCRW